MLPTDEEIIKAVKSFGWPRTAVVRNILSSTYKGIKTHYVLRRLKKLEADGKVKRVPRGKAIYQKQIQWEALGVQLNFF